MAKQEFIRNLRLARNLQAHHVSADHPGMDKKRIEAMLSRADLWLTPAAMRGFHPDDFPELSEESRAALDRSVRAFRHVAAQVPNNGPASTKQEAAARQEFERILRIMEAYLPTTEEVRRLRAAMREVHFPPGALTWEFEFGQDSSGDPAVWIWVVVDDAAVDEATFANATTRFSREIRGMLQKVGLDRWPYVRLRTASEQKSLQAIHS